MSTAIHLLKEKYLLPIQKKPELYVGVELEFPIVNLAQKATDLAVAKGLLSYLIHSDLHFEAEEQDWEGNPIQVVNANGDRILFEVSYNTLEFAFAKAESIQEVEAKFSVYLEVIQSYLRERQHELQGRGIHPFWNLNDNSAVRLPRYQMLLAFLARSKQKKSFAFHSYPLYGSFICGNQVQLDVSRDNYLNVINAFNKIEAAKAYLFANSEFPAEEWDTKIARDIFWEDSMHGYFQENVGVNEKNFQTEEEFFANLAKTAVFTAERKGKYLYFDPIRVDEYLGKDTIAAFDLKGQEVPIKPEQGDLLLHRSYQYQNLTKRGTVEFRSVCTQKFENTFAPTAFHLGLIANLKAFEQLLADNDFFVKYGRDYKALRRYFSRKQLSAQDHDYISTFCQHLLECSAQGLIKRGYGEEEYLKKYQKPLDNR
ncbi:glutamate-cysteine ligase family protein [Streptococcus sp. H49]|uniref:glutamate-cysteine ligase family protein n=1 Tax=Streptococcus huangxiaojuni TaxID=3237239 RepID=UPI0034A57B71